MLVRIKEVVLDDLGTKARIGGHTFSQIEQFAASRGDSSSDDPEAIAKAAKAVRQLVADALNNADPTAAWTEERITKEMDRLTFQRLFDAALEHDGLKLAGDKPSGETPAA